MPPRARRERLLILRRRRAFRLGLAIIIINLAGPDSASKSSHTGSPKTVDVAHTRTRTQHTRTVYRLRPYNNIQHSRRDLFVLFWFGFYLYFFFSSTLRISLLLFRSFCPNPFFVSYTIYVYVYVYTYYAFVCVLLHVTQYIIQFRTPFTRLPFRFQSFKRAPTATTET